MHQAETSLGTAGGDHGLGVRCCWPPLWSVPCWSALPRPIWRPPSGAWRLNNGTSQKRPRPWPPRYPRCRRRIGWPRQANELGLRPADAVHYLQVDAGTAVMEGDTTVAGR